MVGWIVGESVGNKPPILRDIRSGGLSIPLLDVLGSP